MRRRGKKFSNRERKLMRNLGIKTKARLGSFFLLFSWKENLEIENPIYLSADE